MFTQGIYKLIYFIIYVHISSLLIKDVLYFWFAVYFITTIQVLKWKWLSRVQFFATPWTIQSMVFSRPLEWVALPFSRGSSQPRDQTQVSPTAGRFLPAEPQGKPKNTGVGSLSLLQQIFLTQKSNWGLLNRSQILYQLSYQGSQSHNTGNPEATETGPCGHCRYKHKLS